MVSSRQAIACILLSLGVAACVHAQSSAKEQTASISGKVTVKNKGVAGIVVVAIETNDSGRSQRARLRTTTDNDGNYRLSDTTLYTTIEPCVMCAGALVNARVKRLVFGAHDERFGAVETIFRLCDHESLNHRIEITSGVLAEESRALMQEFFRERR